MTEEERLAEASDRLHSLIQELMNEGLLEPGMVQSWYFVCSSFDADGDEGIVLLTDNQSRTSRALGLVRFAEITLEEEVRDWRRD